MLGASDASTSAGSGERRKGEVLYGTCIGLAGHIGECTGWLLKGKHFCTVCHRPLCSEGGGIMRGNCIVHPSPYRVGYACIILKWSF